MGQASWVHNVGLAVRIPQKISSGSRRKSWKEGPCGSHGRSGKGKSPRNPRSLQPGGEGKSQDGEDEGNRQQRARPQERSMAGCAVTAC